MALPSDGEYPSVAGVRMAADIGEPSADVHAVINLYEGTASKIVATSGTIIIRGKINEQAWPVVAVEVSILLPT